MALLPIDTRCDGHVHTRLCRHATGEMEEYVEAAIAVGLKRIIFLEHFEIGVHDCEITWLSEEEFAWYQAEGKRLAKRFQNHIQVGVGVEVGANPLRLAETVAFLNRYDWQRIGLSFHYLRGEEGWVNVVSRRPANLRLLERMGHAQVADTYFAALLVAVQVIPATAVCHLDAVLRHAEGFTLSDSHNQAIAGILQLMRRRKMALEVNTSGYALRGTPFPAAWIIDHAVKLGIELVAGSDAHRPQDVGRFFDRL